jgi:hypothetical protein
MCGMAESDRIGDGVIVVATAMFVRYGKTVHVLSVVRTWNSD